VILDKDIRRAGIMLPILWRKYLEMDEDDPITVKLGNELDYVEKMSKGQILCSYHPSEGCDKCIWKGRCEL